MSEINRRFEKRFGIKVTVLSARMGRRPDFVSKVLRSRGTARIESLICIQRALGCRIADLVEIAVDNWSDGPAAPAVDLRGGS